MDLNQLKQLIGTARDSAVLRMTIAKLLMQQRKPGEAAEQLTAALEMDAGYSAAWKELGKVRLAMDDPEGAAQTWSNGIRKAREQGDKQAEKEMSVFLRRLERETPDR